MRQSLSFELSCLTLEGSQLRECHVMLLLKNGGIWMWNRLASLFISHWRVEVFCWYIQLLAKDCEQHRPSKFSLWETISYGSRTSTRRLLDSAWAFWGCLCNKSKKTKYAYVIWAERLSSCRRRLKHVNILHNRNTKVRDSFSIFFICSQLGATDICRIL